MRRMLKRATLSLGLISILTACGGNVTVDGAGGNDQSKTNLKPSPEDPGSSGPEGSKSGGSGVNRPNPDDGNNPGSNPGAPQGPGSGPSGPVPEVPNEGTGGASVDPTGPISTSSCDNSGDCSTCSNCAVGSTCADGYKNCVNDDECTAYGDCISQCKNLFGKCAHKCKKNHPDGAKEYAQVVNCVICQECSNDCWKEQVFCAFDGGDDGGDGGMDGPGKPPPQ